MIAGVQPVASQTDPVRFLGSLAGPAGVSVTDELDEALAALDKEMARLAETLRVEHVGPGVGMADMGAEHVYRLAVRFHVRDTTTAGWALMVCDALDNNDLRPMWPMQGVGRLRKRQLVSVLPAFFRGYAEAIRSAGKAETDAGRRVTQIAVILAGSDST